MNTRNYVTIVLLYVFFSIPSGYTYAQVETGEYINISGQINAISSYIERTYLPISDEPMSSELLRDTVLSGVRWLIASQEVTGHFRYEYAPYSTELLEDDNIVRQAGTLFELGEVARRSETDIEGLPEAIEKAIGYFTAQSKNSGLDTKCIVQTEISKGCKLGATALALTGILGYLEAYPERIDEYQDLVDMYLEHILLSKKENGGFRNKYELDGNVSDKESSFSNGEALLALVRYYQFNERDDVKEVIDTSYAYLKVQPFDIPLYLWIMAAIKDMQELWPSDAYNSYVKDFTDWRIDGVQRIRGTENNFCAYSEGIVSAYSVLSDSISVAEQQALKDEISFWNWKNYRLQISSDDIYRVMEKNGVFTLAELRNIDIAEGGFLTGQSRVTQRIDFTQHCVSSYLQTLVDIEKASLR